MHELIRRGLEIMRDPATCQAQYAERTSEGCMCAFGCLSQAFVEADKGKWVGFSDLSYMSGEEIDAPWRVLEQETGQPRLDAIIHMNDSDRIPLPEIADYIEGLYAQQEEPSHA